MHIDDLPARSSEPTTIRNQGDRLAPCYMYSMTYSMNGSVYCDTLHRACEILGGAEALGHHLDVTSDQLEAWLKGRATPPVDLFLRAVDVVVEHDVVNAGRGRACSGARER
jgi:hypothetical protein